MERHGSVKREPLEYGGKIKTGHVRFYGGGRSAAPFAPDIYLFFAVCEPIAHLCGSNEQ